MFSGGFFVCLGFLVCFSSFLRCFISELAHLLESNLLAQQVNNSISDIAISNAVCSICQVSLVVTWEDIVSGFKIIYFPSLLFTCCG